VLGPARPVTYGMQADREMRWSAEAEARVQRIPSFVRGVVVKRLEEYARARGLTEVTLDLMAEVRRAMPIDFSKRTPFFMRDE
jgi:light-independent protochlorophyllide reductase subunit B